MAVKNKIPPIAYQFILQKRNDITQIFSFQEIANMLRDEFQIEVTGEAVRRKYQKIKDNPMLQPNLIPNFPVVENNVVKFKSSEVVNLPPIEDENEETLNDVSDKTKKVIFDFKKARQKKIENPDRKFDKKLGDNFSDKDISRLLGNEED